MKTIEKILGLLAIVSVALTILNKNFFAFALFFVLMIALFHYILSFAVLNDVPAKKLFNSDYYKENDINLSRILAAIALGWAFSIVEISMLFEIAHWPGEKNVFITGIVAIAIFYFIFVAVNKDNKKIRRANCARTLTILLSIMIIRIFS